MKYKAKCPVCNGSGRISYHGEERWKAVIAGYDKDTNTLPCRNCGGQYMYGRPTGEVEVNERGEGCTHYYTSQNVGRCLTKYTCQHCGDVYQIDSGD